jgi:phosphoglycolate phosphatase-like HAD superfamily hydrolase
VSARYKLASAGLVVDSFPWATADDALDRANILRAAIERARQKYEEAFEKVVYVGDGVWDVRAAKALGIGFLGLAADTKARRLLEEGALCVLPNFSDLLRVGNCLELVAQKTQIGG